MKKPAEEINVGDRVKAPGHSEIGDVTAVMYPWAKVMIHPGKGGPGKVYLFRIEELVRDA